MNRLIAISILTVFFSAAPAFAESGDSMKIIRNGERPSVQGPEEFFTGMARVDPLFGDEQDEVSAAYVTFEPGARSNWHTHPAGQFLVVTFGKGWVQEAGGERYTIQPGDVVWTPPGVRHWHGASEDVGMTHMAIQLKKNGSVVSWQESVSDGQYQD